MTRGFVRAVARLMAGVLFTAQMAIAAYACPALSPAAAGMGMAMQSADTMARQTDDAASGVPVAKAANCDDMAGAMDPSAANLCAEHCRYGQQSDQASTITVPAALLTALYSMPPPSEPTASPAAARALVAASPPRTVLHCRLLI